MQGCEDALAATIANNPGYNQSQSCAYEPSCVNGFDYDVYGNPIVIIESKETNDPAHQ